MRVGDIIENTYTTNQVAKIIGIHSNTVRMYEDIGFISKPRRKENGYRVFTDLHIEQFRLARIALQIEVLQNGLRKKAISIVKLTAMCEYDEAIDQTKEYISLVQNEIINANEAVVLVEELLKGENKENKQLLKRKEASEILGISMDTLRNWEMNGLLKVRRRENGYRVYTDDDIRKLKIIRSLKCANYSLSAILRMINELKKSSKPDIRTALNTPNHNEGIITACDKLIVSLGCAQKNSSVIKAMLSEMKSKYLNPPL